MTTEKLRELLGEMSLEEKVYQLVQLPGVSYEEEALLTGVTDAEKEKEGVRFLAGSTLGIFGAEKLKAIQEAYLKQQPHQIPLLFMLDVIHGYRTVFPCPLGQGASFDPDTTRECAKIAAAEAAAGGIHVTFAPMADLVRDARWGRVMESTGEDPYLNSRMAAAMVEGFQGQNVGDRGQVAACVKHFAAYGGCVAGLDYQNVELSEHTLRDFYLPAYEAAIKAGCEMVMTSFNTLNGIPSSGNQWLMRKVLREEMGFDGVLISDWGAIGEMIAHGFCEDEREAAKKAILAGVDIDMCTSSYAEQLADLVRQGEISEKLIDEASYRVLSLKNRLGLFENPYKDADAVKECALLLCEEHRALARQAVRESVVLLKNEAAQKGAEKLLPLSVHQKIAFIGPYIEGENLNSSWAVTGRGKDCVSVKEAAQEVFSPEQLSFAKGCTMLDNHTLLNLGSYEEEDFEERNEKLLAEALSAAEAADVVVLCLGEHRQQSGEATSRAHITLPAVQLSLLRRISQVNPNVVTVLFNGRPLELSMVQEYSRAILEAWLPGTEGGHGILDVLTGKAVPCGKLPMSFPHCVGQLPMSYNSYSSGRPRPSEGRGDYTSRYLDVPNEPLYSFGYGLSYTQFDLSLVTLSQSSLKKGETMTASVTVKNVGEYKGTEVLQLYIRDLSASRVRPVKELKGFQKVCLNPGEERRVVFEITEELLRFHTISGEVKSEPGSFRLWIGNSSDTQNAAEFVYME